MLSIHLFIFLQVFDLLTTVVGFRVGAAEASPFVRALMWAGPTSGVALSKVLALVLGGVCIATQRHKMIKLANYWFTAVVMWNVGVICVAVSRCV